MYELFNEQILSGLRPNFFELIAQEAMHEALKPAFEYVCKVMVHNRPDLFQHIWRGSDEVYLLLESLLQLYFLQKHSGSFSETFYDLQRVPSGKGRGRLGAKEKCLSLFSLVVVPYLKVKLDKLYYRLLEENDSSAIRWSRGDRLELLFRFLYFKSYPYMYALWEGTKFLFRLRYLFGQTDYYSPLMLVSGVAYSRMLDLGLGSRYPSDSTWRKVMDSLLPLAVFGLKFLEWWYSNERSAVVKMVTSLPLPPPPSHRDPGVQGIGLPANPQLCPICRQHRKDATTIATSGYVFCYTCILEYLRKNGKCPVSGLPTTEKQLIKLFTEQQSST